MTIEKKDVVEDLQREIETVLCPHGFEVRPFLTGWYNQLVADKFHLDYPEDTLAFVIISQPSMFEKAFLPFLSSHYKSGIFQWVFMLMTEPPGKAQSSGTLLTSACSTTSPSLPAAMLTLSHSTTSNSVHLAGRKFSFRQRVMCQEQCGSTNQKKSKKGSWKRERNISQSATIPSGADGLR